MYVYTVPLQAVFSTCGVCVRACVCACVRASVSMVVIHTVENSSNNDQRDFTASPHKRKLTNPPPPTNKSHGEKLELIELQTVVKRRNCTRKRLQEDFCSHSHFSFASLCMPSAHDRHQHAKSCWQHLKHRPPSRSKTRNSSPGEEPVRTVSRRGLGDDR